MRRVREVARARRRLHRERARPRDLPVRQSARRVDPAASDLRDEEPGTLTAAMHNAYGAPDANDNSRGAQLAAEFNRRLQRLTVPCPTLRSDGGGARCVRLSDPDLVSSRMVHRHVRAGHHNLNLVIVFPQVDPATEGLDPPTRVTRSSSLVRRLPEFKFCTAASRASVSRFADALLRV